MKKDDEIGFVKKTGIILTTIISTFIILGGIAAYIKDISVAEANACAENKYVSNKEFKSVIEPMATDIRELRIYLMGRK